MTTSNISDPVGGSPSITGPLFNRFVCDDQLSKAEPFPHSAIGKKADTIAVILAGGSGDRFGYRKGKQMIEVLGRPLLSWTLSAFDACEQVARIVVVCPASRIEEYRETAVDPFNFETPIDFAQAGILRQESALNGIALAASYDYEYIAIHDGARPLVTADLIMHALNVLKGTLDADGVVVGHPAIDTMKVIEGDKIVGTPDRSMFWIAQTPQIFHAQILRQAHAAAMSEGYVGTDDSSLVERIGGKVLLVGSSRNNIKVTVPEDIGPVIAALQTRLTAHHAGEHNG